MAVFNILTDLALVVFPFPILRYVKLDKKAYAHLFMAPSLASQFCPTDKLLGNSH